MEKKFNFKNKTIFLTGSNGFLGKELQKTFLKFGGNLILTDKHSNNVLKNKFKYYKCDLTDIDSQNKLINDIKKKINKIDVVINNASFTGNTNLNNWSTDFLNQDVDQWEKVFNVSVKASFQISKGFYNLLKKGKGGSVINIASIYGFMGPDWQMYKNTNIFNPAGYGISKSGMIYLTKWLASSMSSKVRINCISPGGIFRNQDKLFVKNYIKKVPLKRMCSEKDVIGSILFLASDYSKYMTGQNIVIDGGYSII